MLFVYLRRAKWCYFNLWGLILKGDFAKNACSAVFFPKKVLTFDYFDTKKVLTIVSVDF